MATTKQLEVIEGELMRGMETEGETTIVKELQAALFPVCPKGKIFIINILCHANIRARDGFFCLQYKNDT